MDELGALNLKEFKRFIKRDTVHYLEGDYPIEELLFIAGKSCLYIGSDSGISNLLQTPTNALLFYGTGNHFSWRPYSRHPYLKRTIKDMAVEDTVTSQDLKKKVIYAPVWCRPCLDVGCHKPRCTNLFNNFTTAIAEEIDKITNG